MEREVNFAIKMEKKCYITKTPIIIAGGFPFGKSPHIQYV